MKWIDMPPVWLVAFMALAWSAAPYLQGLGLGPAGRWSGAAAMTAGLLLAGTAALQFRRHRTTIVPHETPARLITTGVYRLSRNPIYLADVLILAGWCLWIGATFALLLVPLFVLVIEWRFIRPEEARLSAKFIAEFERYTQQTNRWL